MTPAQRKQYFDAIGETTAHKNLERAQRLNRHGHGQEARSMMLPSILGGYITVAEVAKGLMIPEADLAREVELLRQAQDELAARAANSG